MRGHLVVASEGSKSDPLGLLYDGHDLILEYIGTGKRLRRYARPELVEGCMA